MRLIRAFGLVLVLVVCAWFALGIRQARDTNLAGVIVSGPVALRMDRAARTASLLRAAGALNPDSEVDILRGELALLENDRAKAKRILRNVVRREPLNLRAWVWLSKSAVGDRRLISDALGHVALLDPSVVSAP